MSAEPSGNPAPNSGAVQNTSEPQHESRRAYPATTSSPYPPAPSTQLGGLSEVTRGDAAQQLAGADARVPPPAPLPQPSQLTTSTPANNGTAYSAVTPGEPNFPVYQPYQPNTSPYPTSSNVNRSASPVEGQDGTPSSEPPKKRRRPALSCEPCRRRKVKCDRSHPCGPCVRMGHPAACEYDNRFPRPGVASMSEFSTTPQPPSYRPLGALSYQPSPSTGSGARSLADFEAEVRNHAYASASSAQAANGSTHGNATLATGTPNDHLSYALRDLQDRIMRLERTTKEAIHKSYQTIDPALQQSISVLNARIQGLESALRNPKEGLDIDDQSTGLSVAVPAPRTRVNSSRVKFWGPSHYMHLFDKKSEFLDQIVADDGRYKFNTADHQKTALAIPLLQSVKSLRRDIKEQQIRRIPQHPETLAQVLITLPPLDVRDQLVGHYLRTFELIYRIFHIPSLREMYDQHFRQLELAPAVVQAQLLLVFAIGLVFADESHRKNLLPMLPRWLHAVQANMAGLMENNLDNEDWLRVYCLLFLARHANSIGTKEQTYALAGAMTRNAMALGFHRDPIHLPNLSPFRAELRRRLWSTVLELGLMSSFDAAMPPLVVETDYDCEAPANVDDQHMVESAAVAQNASSHDVYTSTSIQLLLRGSFEARLEVCRMLNNYKQDLSYDKALQLSTTIEEACKAMSDYFGKHLNHFADWSRPKDLHKHIVGATCWSTLLSLHRAFYSAARTDQRFHFSRYMCLEAAKAVIAPLAELDSKSPAFDDYSKLILAGRGTFKAPLSLGASGLIVLEVFAKLDAAKPMPSRMSPPDFEGLISILEHIRTQCLQLIKGRGSSCKRYLYLSVALAMVKAVEAGKEANSAVSSAVRDSLKTCLDSLRRQADLSLSNSASGSTSSDVAMAGIDHEYDLSVFENMSINFDPSWLLTAWELTEGRR